MDAVKTNNVTGCLNILAHSSPEDINTLHEQPEGWAAMHVACMFGKTVILQLLIWVRSVVLIRYSGADMDVGVNARTDL